MTTLTNQPHVPLGKIKVHNSDLNQFAACEQKFKFTSPLYGNWEPKAPYTPFLLGRIVHTALEDYYTRNVPLNDAVRLATDVELDRAEIAGTNWDHYQDFLVDEIPLINGIMEHYAQWTQSKAHRVMAVADQHLEFLTMEDSFEVPMPTVNGGRSTMLTFGGRFDGIVRDKRTGALWVFETKTTQNISKLIATLHNAPQATRYTYAAQQLLGERVEGVIYNIILKQTPQKPKVLKNGKLSKDKRCKTTAQVYLAAIREQHPDYDDNQIKAEYGDILRHYSDQGNTFFARVKITRTQQQLDIKMRQSYLLGMRIRKTQHFVANESWLCPSCQFQEPCGMILAGYEDGAQEVLKRAYRKRQDRILRPILIDNIHFAPLGQLDGEDMYTLIIGNEIIKRRINYDTAVNEVEMHIDIETSKGRWRGMNVDMFHDALENEVA